MNNIEIKTLGTDYTVEIIKLPLKTLGREEVELLTLGLDNLITENWGSFGKKFVNDHIMTSYLMAILKDRDGKFIGFATISKKNLCKRDIYYFEFTVVDKAHQSKGLAQKLNKILTRRLYLDNILKLRFSLEFFVITPNMKVMASLAKYASFMYPNPYAFSPSSKRISKADDLTWEMTKDLIQQSDSPKRKISREGNVLEGSYELMPWLIYDERNIPKHSNPLLNDFGEHYLEYKKRTGKEFIVRVIFNFRSLIRSFFK